jgi:hypothetical protein
MMKVQEKKKSPKIDEFVVLLNAQMEEQINNKQKLCKLLGKRKRLSRTALDVWQYNRMHRKDNIFSTPLIHGKLDHDLFFLMDLAGAFLFSWHHLALLQECVVTSIIRIRLNSLEMCLH